MHYLPQTRSFIKAPMDTIKSILIPTDFSACAEDALDAGMQLAEKFRAKVHLYTNLELPWNWETMTETERSNHKEAVQLVKNADIFFKDIRKRYWEINIETHYSGGSLVESIKDLVAALGIDFIVMGSHGKSGKNEYFIGSNTQRVVRLVHCPVLVVKDKLEKVSFDKVVYASAFFRSEKEAFLKFKGFIKHFIPELHLVAVQTSSLFDPPYVVQKEALEDFQKLAAPLKCETHIYRDFSVDKGVRSFAEDIGADLVVISNHQRSPMKRMIVGSNVEALVNHSNLPVLTIDYPEES